MKKSSSSLVGDPLIEADTFYGINNSFEDQEFLLFITDITKGSLTGINIKARNIFSPDINPDQKDHEFYQRVVHREDYSRFIQHLESCDGSEPGTESEIQVRLRNKRGQWKNYLFKHRLYTRKGFDDNHIIGVAREVRELESQIQKALRTNPTTEAALQESRNKYKTLLNSIDQGFTILEIIFDLEGKPFDFMFLESNDAFAHQAELENADGNTIMERIPDFEEHWLNTYGNVALTGKPVRFQEFSEALNKTWFDVYAFPIGEKKNKKVGLLFLDITQRKIAENQLRELNDSLEEKVNQRTRELNENSQLLQTVFDTTNEGIVVFKPVHDPAGVLVDFEYYRVNKVITEQYNMDRMEGKRFLEINPHAIELGVFEKFRDTFLTGKEKNFELYYDYDHHNSWFRLTTKRENGLLITSVEDITRQKQESQRMKENIRFRKQLAETSPDIIMIFNLYEEKIKFINRDLSPLPGMKKNEVLGKHLTDIFPFIHPREREKGMDFHQQIINGSNENITEMEFRLKGENRRWEWYSALGKVFMRNKKGNVYEYIVLLRNVDEQKKTHKALLRAEKLSIKGEVARTLAHELRNPMASIGMASDILEGSIPEEKKAELESYFKIIKRSTKVLNNLVTDLLTTSNYSPPELKKKSLAEIIESSLKLASDRIYLSGIRVTKDYPEQCYINADEEKLKIALLNIIINASEAMDPDQGILKLHIGKETDNYVLTIKDNGHGLEKDQVDQLFDAFYTQKADGVGVGMSSVKNILEEHDARITVDSELNKGTVFKLSFQCYEVFERT